jgi:hypothetical protein
MVPRSAGAKGRQPGRHGLPGANGLFRARFLREDPRGPTCRAATASIRFRLAVARTGAAMTLAMVYPEAWQLGDCGGVNRHVRTGRTISPAHARAPSRAPKANDEERKILEAMESDLGRPVTEEKNIWLWSQARSLSSAVRYSMENRNFCPGAARQCR